MTFHPFYEADSQSSRPRDIECKQFDRFVERTNTRDRSLAVDATKADQPRLTSSSISYTEYLLTLGEIFSTKLISNYTYVIRHS